LEENLLIVEIVSRLNKKRVKNEDIRAIEDVEEEKKDELYTR
jgi:hypothetical protein